jgi:hypothetical protein
MDSNMHLAVFNSTYNYVYVKIKYFEIHFCLRNRPYTQVLGMIFLYIPLPIAISTIYETTKFMLIVFYLLMLDIALYAAEPEAATY